MQSYWTTTKLWELTVVLDYYEATVTYSRIGLGGYLYLQVSAYVEGECTVRLDRASKISHEVEKLLIELEIDTETDNK